MTQRNDIHCPTEEMLEKTSGGARFDSRRLHGFSATCADHRQPPPDRVDDVAGCSRRGRQQLVDQTCGP